MPDLDQLESIAHESPLCLEDTLWLIAAAREAVHLRAALKKLQEAAMAYGCGCVGFTGHLCGGCQRCTTNCATEAYLLLKEKTDGR